MFVKAEPQYRQYRRDVERLMLSCIQFVLNQRYKPILPLSPSQVEHRMKYESNLYFSFFFIRTSTSGSSRQEGRGSADQGRSFSLITFRIWVACTKIFTYCPQHWRSTLGCTSSWRFVWQEELQKSRCLSEHSEIICSIVWIYNKIFASCTLGDIFVNIGSRTLCGKTKASYSFVKGPSRITMREKTQTKDAVTYSASFVHRCNCSKL